MKQFTKTYRLEPGCTGEVLQSHSKKAKKQLRRIRVISLAFNRSRFRHLSPYLMNRIPVLCIRFL